MWQVIALVIGAIASLLTAVGFGGLVTTLLLRKFARTDKLEGIHESTRAAEIGAETTLAAQFREDLLGRVKSLEEEAGRIRGSERALAVENAELKRDNVNLKEKNVEQADEIRTLGQSNNDLKGSISILQEQFNALKLELNATTQELHLLKSHWNKLGRDPAIEIEREVLRRIGSIELNKPKKVVLIDDDIDHLELMTAVLKDHDIEAVSFQNGGEAVEWLRHENAGAIVADLAIDKDLDGLTLIEKIRGHERRNRKVPAHIIIYSGYDSNEGIRQDARELNVEAILRKATHTPQDVGDMLRKLLLNPNTVETT